MKKEQMNYRTRGSKKKVWLKAFLLALCFVVMSSSAGNAIRTEQLQINPFIEVRGVYETNVFRVTQDQEEDSDFVTVISPGIHFEFPTAQDSVLRAVANYRADIEFYGNNGDSEIDPDEELNAMAHRLDGELALKFASGLRFKTGYILNLTSVPPDFRGDTRNEYTEHRFMAQTAYAFADRYEVQLQYDGAIRSYDDSANEVDDFTKHGFEGTMFYRILSKTSILGGGGYAMINREEPTFSDSTEYTGFGGIRYEATENVTGILKIGAVSKNFDSEYVDDTTEVYASGEMRAELLESTTLSLRLHREIVETSVSNDTEASGAYYIVTGINASIAHKLAALPNMTLSGAFSYSNEEYPEDIDERSDDNLEVGLGIDYKFLKYLVIGANYTYSTTDSNIDANDFSDNIVIMKLRAIL